MEFGWTLRWIIESQNRSQFAARGSCRRNAGMFRIVPECASQYRRWQNEPTAVGSHARSVGKWSTFGLGRQPDQPHAQDVDHGDDRAHFRVAAADGAAP